MTWHQRYLDRFYRSDPHWIDGTTEFHELCRTVVPTDSTILEVGAGPTNPTSRFLATLGEVDGIDPDPDVQTNQWMRKAYVMSGETFDRPDDTYDVCVSNFVIEHVADPDAHLAEVRRILKPEGYYVFRTPNLHHYVGMVSHLTPHWFHRMVANRLRGMPEGSHEPYPTHYALNTKAAFELFAPRNGFVIRELRFVEKEPSYGAAAPPLFLAGLAYERVVNSTGMLAPFRSSIFGVLAAR